MVVRAEHLLTAVIMGRREQQAEVIRRLIELIIKFVIFITSHAECCSGRACYVMVVGDLDISAETHYELKIT